MATRSPEDRREDYRTPPEPIRYEDMITTQETREAPSPTMGRDAETDWLLRDAG